MSAEELLECFTADEAGKIERIAEQTGLPIEKVMEVVLLSDPNGGAR